MKYTNATRPFLILQLLLQKQRMQSYVESCTKYLFIGKVMKSCQLRKTIMKVLQELDPEGVALRSKIS